MSEEITKNVIKTGTVTIGLVCKDGLVVAADERITYAGQGGVAYFAGKLKKIIEINDRMVATMAGTASDAKRSLSLLRAEIKLKELKTREKTSVPEAASLLANMVFQNIRTPSMIPSIAHFLVGGHDEEGVHLYDVAPDGHIKEIETYEASGSGIMQAHPILDSEYKKGMSIEEGINLAVKAIRASAGRDPAVGDGIDVYVIKPGELNQVMHKDIVREVKDSA